jgi:competence protein ComEC
MLREQWVVTLALTPLTLLWFGQMSVVGMVANAFAIFWVTLVVTPLSMLGVLLPPVWVVANGAIAVLMAWLEWLSAMPWATLSLAIAPIGFSVAAVLGGGLLVLRLPWHLRLFGLPLLLAVFLWRPVLPLPGAFEVLALDVGQGTAVLLRTSGHALLFDAGPRYSVDSDAGHRVLLPLLQALQTRLDTVVLSHRDSDHVGGAAAVLAMQPQALLLSSLEAGHPLQVAQESKQLAQRCVAGQRWHWDGVWFEVLHPTQQDYTSALKPNAVSCVLRVSNGQQSVLLTGDIEKAQEAGLLQRNPALQADVLLVAHHGSKTSSSEAFLDAVRPRIALVQSGYRNRFGHPAAQVVQRFVARHIALYDSPHCGAMLWHSAQAQTVQCWRDVQTHYWSHRIQ